MRRSSGGALVGMDILVGDWLLGGMAGYSQTMFKGIDRSSWGSSQNYHLRLYGGTEWADFAIRIGAAYTRHQIQVNRIVDVPGLFDNLSSHYAAQTFQAFGELAYGLELASGTHIEPFANLAYVNMGTDGFSEQGGAAGVNGGHDAMSVTFPLWVCGSNRLSRVW